MKVSSLRSRTDFMFTKKSKNQKRGHIHDRIRKKMQGTAERPRLNVYRSLNHIYVQVIDDLHGQTLVSGKTIAARAKAKGVKKVVFDRGGYIYPGRVKALADAAREGGLEF